MPSSILYLDEAQALALAPDALEAVDLVADAMRGIAAGRAELAHHVIHPSPGTGLSAIIGVLRGNTRDLAGQKWVSESREAGVAALLMLNDPQTGLLHTLMGARGLTGLRTAAASGACVRALAPPGPVVLVGTGLQCRWHLRVLHALGRREVRIAYRRRESMEAVLRWALDELPDMTLVACDRLRDAVADAGTVITMVTRGTTGAELPVDGLRSDALLLPVDFAHCVGAEVAARATLIATDHPATYAEAVAHDALPGYPVQAIATGAAIDLPRPSGWVLVQNLGNAASDLAIADRVRRRALERGLGIPLPV